MTDPLIVGNRYRIIERIAEGMAGPVYRGVDEYTDKPVALKALRPELLDEHPSMVERFRREGEALRQLDHPNIVRRLDLIEQDRVHYLVMDYIRGGSLRDLLRRRPQLSVDRVLEISLDLVDALTRTHRQGIVHRDLKPENVLLKEDGTPCLSDFGVAHYIHRTTVTQPGGFAGTWSYIPPESFLGQEPDVPGDIWSLGVIMFEMLSGRLPFKENTIAGLLNAILTQPPPDLAELRSDIPADLVNLMYLMLDKDPSTRISSVRQVGAALESIRRGEAVPLPHSRRARTSPAHDSLPKSGTLFIGRTQDIIALKRLIIDEDHRLVTLTGPGGVGKSRLALQVADQMADYYEGGRYFVDLAPISNTELIQSRVAQAIGVKGGPRRLLMDAIVDQLKGRRCLLILDNFEQLIEAAQLVADFVLTLPELTVIVTSREPLHLYAEQAFPVDPLPLPSLSTNASVPVVAQSDSVALFIQRARSVSPDFELTQDNVDAVAEICVRLDGLPLAIELAAARIRLFPPAYLLSRLDDALAILTGGARDLAVRHQTMRAAIDWSFRLLKKIEQSLFARLAVFHGGSTLEAIEAVCTPGSKDATLSTLESLINKNLVLQAADDLQEPRFLMLETIQQYAAERLSEFGEEEEMRRLHAEYFTAFIEGAEPKLRGPDQEEWSARIRLEYDNLRAALNWALDGADPNLGARIAGALGEFWYYEGPLSEGELWNELALVWRGSVEPVARAKLLNGASMTAFASGEYGQGREWNQEALSIARPRGDKQNLAWALFWLSAHATFDPAEYENGILYLDEAISIFTDLGDEAGLAWSYNQIGELSRLLGDYGKAREGYEACVDVCRRSGNRRREAIALVNLSYVAQHQGEFAQAERYGCDGLKLLHSLKLEYHSAIALAMLAGPVAAQQREIQAARLLGASEAIFERIAVDLQPADQIEIEHYRTLIRKQLGEVSFQEALNRGREMTLEEAIAYALMTGPGRQPLFKS